ncbi:hypothetical protein [Prescottella agglutinans]|nr:hypothetical protein [Prescottella agglutinans]
MTTSGIWHRPPGLYAVELWLRGGGAGGQIGAGGGGGATVMLGRRLSARELPEQVAVTVGAGGAGATLSTPATDGGDTWFGEFVRAPGGRAAYGTELPWGGFAPMRGGIGGTNGPGETVSQLPENFLAGGGGGGGPGFPGGGSGLTDGGAIAAPGISLPPWWEWMQTGSGGGGATIMNGSAGGAGGFPAGGGGARTGNPAGGNGGNGGGGCCTIHEILFDEEN